MAYVLKVRPAAGHIKQGLYFLPNIQRSLGKRDNLICVTGLDEERGFFDEDRDKEAFKTVLLDSSLLLLNT